MARPNQRFSSSSVNAILVQLGLIRVLRDGVPALFDRMMRHSVRSFVMAFVTETFYF
jgi:hypothetical protein